MSQAYQCRIQWEVPDELETFHPDWPTTNWSLESDITLKQLLEKLKQEISQKLERCDEFSKKGISNFMTQLTEQINKGKDSSAQAAKSTFWLIRFRTTLNDKHNLDSGIWLRFSKLSDIIRTPCQVGVRVQLELEECQRGNAYHQDTSLHNHIYTRRPRSTHFFIGTVQNQEAQKRDIQLLETADKAKPIERKNVILARFEETNGFRMLGTFRILNTWRFVTADGKSYFARIGDVEGGIACDLAFLDRNKVKLSRGYQENGSNVDLGELRRRVGKRLGELRKDKKKWDGAEREVPKLPPLTLQHFPAAQLHDASNVLKDGVKGLAVVRVVYMLPAAALGDHAKRSPQNCYFDIDKTTTFADMDAVLLSGNAPSHQRIERGVRHIRPTRVWWIMDPRMEGDIGKMYRVNKMSTQVCRYIKDAPSSDGFTLYTECHIRGESAKHEYDEDGK